MGGTWMSFVMGLGGMRVVDGELTFNPFLPEKWKSYSFRVDFGGAHLELKKEAGIFTVVNHSDADVIVTVWGTAATVKRNSSSLFETLKYETADSQEKGNG